jgi:Flp pilus assembly protein TadD
MALSKAGDWPSLMAHCRRWTQAEPGNDLAWSNRGDAYDIMGRHREAIAAYREALRLKPDQEFIWFLLGVAYGKMGRWGEAI